MPADPIDHPARTHRRWPARIALVAFVGFWTWFVVSVMASEGIAPWPIGMLAALWTTGALTWIRPRIGGVALVLLGAAALWQFPDPERRWHAAFWLIALPAWAIAFAAFLGAPRRQAPRDATATVRT